MKTRTGVSDLIIQSDANQNRPGKSAISLQPFQRYIHKRIGYRYIKIVGDSKLEDINISKKDVVKKLMKLKSPGPDAICPRLLKETAEELGMALEIIYNSTLEKGSMPNECRQAHISAIFTKGSKKLACNYRPVSLTCIACEIMESLVRDVMIAHMNRNNLLSNRQYVFIRGISTALQILKIFDTWTEILDRGGELDVIYLDFMKPFDTVPHKRLIGKLRSYGMSGKIVRWVTSFLLNRRQRVSVKVQFLAWADVLRGTPPPRECSRTNFINDLADNMISEVFMCADDIKVFREIRSNEDIQTLQKDLNNLQGWSKKWLLRFRPEKCKVMMTISRRNRTRINIPRKNKIGIIHTQITY